MSSAGGCKEIEENPVVSASGVPRHETGVITDKERVR